MQSAPESRWARLLLAAWYGRRPVYTLVPLCWLFVLVTALRRWLFACGVMRVERLPVPVVVVGNVVVGGAGKTPLVSALVKALRDAGRRPGILSRGYGGRWTRAGLVTPDTPVDDCGDEALLLARALAVPVAVARRRADGGRLLLAAHPDCDVLVCDDGLQHYALARDVELVVVDRARGFGNGWRLPAGPLREPLERLRSVHGLLLHGEAADAQAAARLEATLPDAPRQWPLTLHMQDPQRRSDGLVRAWPEWHGVRVHAVAGIGHPERFFAGLRALGLQVEAHAFPDHHAYQPSDLRLPGDAPVLLTAKDAVKLGPEDAMRQWVVPLSARLPADLLPWLLDLLENARGRKTA